MKTKEEIIKERMKTYNIGGVELNVFSYKTLPPESYFIVSPNSEVSQLCFDALYSEIAGENLIEEIKQCFEGGI